MFRTSEKETKFNWDLPKTVGSGTVPFYSPPPDSEKALRHLLMVPNGDSLRNGAAENPPAPLHHSNGSCLKISKSVVPESIQFREQPKRKEFQRYIQKVSFRFSRIP